eukprot:jgi/Psemu1/26841/gm1.26841_g
MRGTSLPQTVVVHITEINQIKEDCKGEDIKSVVELFKALCNNKASLHDGTLPENAVKNLLDIIQMTSMPAFNDMYRDLKKQRLNNEIKAAIDSLFAQTLQKDPGINHLSNNIASVNTVLTYAELIHPAIAFIVASRAVISVSVLIHEMQLRSGTTS